MALSDLERQHRQIEREKAVGIIRRTVKIPEHREAELAAIVKLWRQLDGSQDAGKEQAA
jgi:hypothetical protein